MALPLRRSSDVDVDPACRVDRDRRALGVAGLRGARLALVGRLREGDVAHVRDRRLDHAREADADETALGPCLLRLGPTLVVAGELERLVEACLVVARVVEPTGWGLVRHRRNRDEVPARELGRVETEPARGDRHRSLEPEVELRPAEAAVESRRQRVREHDPVAHGDVPHAVGAGERAVHPVERRRLRRPHVGADVLDRVVAQRDQLPVRREACFDISHSARRRSAPGQMLDPVLRPADGHAELPGGEPEQHDVREDRRLDPERAAGVGGRDQAELVPAQPERGCGDAVERERALEVRPGRELRERRIPVRDDGIALDWRAREAGEAEPLAHHEIGRGQRCVDVAVVERAVVDARGQTLQRIDDRVERVVVDLHELRCVLRHVAVPGDDHRERLADVAGDVHRRRVLRHARVDPGREGPRELLHVGAGEDADHARVRERGARIERDPRVRPAASGRSPRGRRPGRARGRRGTGPGP